MNKFDEWMSGRRWLGDKAPTEGFYGRYTEGELEVAKLGYNLGITNDFFEYPNRLMTEKEQYILRWAYEVGQLHFGVSNEKSE